MEQLTEDNFLDGVALYVKLHDEILSSQKELKELRKRKVDLGNDILEYMKSKDIDAFQMPDGKLKRHQTKHTESIKKEHFLETLKEYVPDPVRCEAAYIELCARRKTEFRDALKRTRARGGN